MMMWKSAAVASAPPDGHSLQGVELTHVPYKGGGPLMTDAIGGQVPLAIGSAFLVNPHVKAGKIKAGD
ncbi:MAG: hypothetical protein IPJ28_03395 [Betaproteobacteria bacterium]|nr:hypothetical protein [Betaproteobacteria bacterium]